MSKQRGYTTAEVMEAIQFMEKLIRKPEEYTREDFNQFFDKHPWALKYASPQGFSEANQLRKMSESPDFSITQTVMTKKEKELRLQRNMSIRHLIFQTPQGLGRLFVFRFELHDGLYWPTNG